MCVCVCVFVFVHILVLAQPQDAEECSSVAPGTLAVLRANLSLPSLSPEPTYKTQALPLVWIPCPRLADFASSLHLQGFTLPRRSSTQPIFSLRGSLTLAYSISSRST